MADANGSIAAAIIQVAAWIAAIIGVIFAGVQLRASRRLADLKALQDFFQIITEREKALQSANDENARTHAFFEFMNSLEIYSAAINHRLISKISQTMVHEKIRDSIVEIQLAPQWLSKFEVAITSHTTFKELSVFMKKNRAEIKGMVYARRKNDAAQIGTTNK